MSAGPHTSVVPADHCSIRCESKAAAEACHLPMLLPLTLHIVSWHANGNVMRNQNCHKLSITAKASATELCRSVSCSKRGFSLVASGRSG